MKEQRPTNLLIGIDIGGTFTDFVIHDPESKQLNTYKVLSTPENPAEAVFQGLSSLFDNKIIPELDKPTGLTITHGSTVATNALLERKGARTALVTTSGFRDVIEIGRQDRPNLYDLNVKSREVIVPPAWRLKLMSG